MQVKRLVELSARGQHNSDSAFYDALEFRQIRNVPAAAERFDQQHAGVRAPPQDIGLVSFISQSRRLSGDDLKVRIDAAFVTIREEL